MPPSTMILCRVAMCVVFAGSTVGQETSTAAAATSAATVAVNEEGTKLVISAGKNRVVSIIASALEVGSVDVLAAMSGNTNGLLALDERVAALTEDISKVGSKCADAVVAATTDLDAKVDANTASIQVPASFSSA